MLLLKSSTDLRRFADKSWRKRWTEQNPQCLVLNIWRETDYIYMSFHTRYWRNVCCSTGISYKTKWLFSPLEEKKIFLLIHDWFIIYGMLPQQGFSSLDESICHSLIRKMYDHCPAERRWSKEAGLWLNWTQTFIMSASLTHVVLSCVRKLPVLQLTHTLHDVNNVFPVFLTFTSQYIKTGLGPLCQAVILSSPSQSSGLLLWNRNKSLQPASSVCVCVCVDWIVVPLVVL